MIAYCNTCKEHDLPLKYICMQEDCSCIAKRYCQKCSDAHLQKHNSKCLFDDQICKRIKSCVQPRSKLKEENRKIKQDCMLMMKNKKIRDMEASKIIGIQFAEYNHSIQNKIKTFFKFIEQKQAALKQIHKDSKIKFITQLQENQLLMARINLSNAQGLLQLHRILASSKQAFKLYDLFLEETKNYGKSKQELLLILDRKDRLFIKSVKETLGSYRSVRCNQVKDAHLKQEKVKPCPNLQKKGILEISLHPLKAVDSNKQNCCQ